jgi:alpha-mannosidase
MRGEYSGAQVGEQFGPVWSTHWFRVDIRIPDEWRGQEVHLLFNSNSEACVWENGQPLQGLTGTDREGFPIRPQFVLGKPAQGGELRTLSIEVACNQMFGLENFDPRRIGWLQQAEIATFDREAWDLLWDFVVVADMAQHLPPETPGPVKRSTRRTRWSTPAPSTTVAPGRQRAR